MPCYIHLSAKIRKAYSCSILEQKQRPTAKIHRMRAQKIFMPKSVVSTKSSLWELWELFKREGRKSVRAEGEGRHQENKSLQINKSS